jgi:phytol kinase
MTRTGDRREILRGPLYYGIVFVAFTLIFWRTTPIGPVALMILCAGDGLAGVVGVRRGRTPLPHNPEKTFEGSASMFVGGLLASLAIVLIFQAAGVFVPQIAAGHAARAIVVISLAATLVESLPLPDIDNLTVSLTAAALGVLLF